MATLPGDDSLLLDWPLTLTTSLPKEPVASDPPGARGLADGGSRAGLPLLLATMVFPTVAALFYFLYLGSSRAAPWAYGVAKVLQFSLPFLVVGWWRFGDARWRAAKSAYAGIAAGVLGSVPLLALYLLLHDSPLTGSLAHEVAVKTRDFGLSSPLRYTAMALFLSFLHSGLEELYWRGFVYGQLRSRVRDRTAMILASLAFASHHVVVIARFAATVEGAVMTLLLVTVGGAGVWLAGMLWCWLFRRSGSLLAPWLSHVVMDLAVMAVGYLLIY